MYIRETGMRIIWKSGLLNTFGGIAAGKECVDRVGKIFNINGDCKPEIHYMVDISEKLNQIKRMVDAGQYFTINRARQYGKTTTLGALEKFLSHEYYVVSLDFQMLGHASFETEQMFVEAFSSELFTYADEIPEEIRIKLNGLTADESRKCTLQNLFRILSRWCRLSERKIVLMIDEVDSATNNQVFLDFLAQLRGYYIKRDKLPSFQSVILAGVYDVKNIKRKIRPDDEHKTNSPWNIAADFDVEMGFFKDEIVGMLCEYEADHHTGMNKDEIAGLLYEYTSGYPYLVSRLCKLMDEKVAGNSGFTGKTAWTKQGFLEAVKILLSEKNTLFESLMDKVHNSENFQKTLCDILFGGKEIVYNTDDPTIDLATMFGFIKNDNGKVAVANRIFETRLYNYFLTTSEAQREPIFLAAANDKSQFIHDGYLDMDRVIRKFVEYFDDIYGDQNSKFDEEEGRRKFMAHLRPIINGTGNYHIEERTRNARRMDVVVDYLGKTFIIELKVWRGKAYHEQGEKQLLDYLNYKHLKKGYLLTYNFNKKKEIGVREVSFGDRILIEAMV